jgi:hypothetical protein
MGENIKPPAKENDYQNKLFSRPYSEVRTY